MDPKEYLDRYTYLTFPNPFTGQPEAAGMSGYGSGWGVGEHPNRPNGQTMQHEYLHGFRPALRKYLIGNANKSEPSPMTFNGEGKQTKIDPAEPFFRMSFIRAFLGKGSPDEVADTLRVAMVIGRIGSGKDANNKPAACLTAAEYATKFMTLDCNGLTGNYYGINPETACSGYAVPARKRSRAADVRVGDVVVTLKDNGKYSHVALVAYWDCPSASAESGKVKLKLCEWGQAGDETKHYTGETPIELEVKRGAHKGYGVGFSRKSGQFRYIFAPPPPVGGHRGWGLGENMEL